MYEPSFRRLAADLSKLAGVRLLLMRPDGSISLDGAPVTAEDARPEVGWLSADLFGEAPIRGYMTALLKSPDLKWVQSGAAGFDDPVFGGLLDPPVTALRRGDLELGRAAATRLLDALATGGVDGDAETRIPVELVVRRSCGCAA